MNGFAESSTTSCDRGNRTTTPISKQEKQNKQHHTPYELAMQNLQTIHNDVIQCGLCFKTLIDAHVLDHPDCLHRFCGTCINDSLQIMNNGECPICRVHIPCMTQIKRDPQFDAMVSVYSLERQVFVVCCHILYVLCRRNFCSTIVSSVHHSLMF